MRDAVAREKKDGPRRVATTEDRFVDSLFHGWTWLQHNQRKVVGLTIVLVLLVAGAVYYMNFRQTVAVRSAVELQNLRAGGMEPLVMVSQLESFVGRFDGTQAADEARITLARIQLDLDQTDAALATLVSASQGLDQPMGLAARNLLAIVYEKQGDTDAAIRTLDQIGAGAEYDFQRREARARKARILTSLGQLAEAEAIYAALAEEASDDVLEQSGYRVRLGEVRALQSAAARPGAASMPSTAEPAAAGEESAAEDGESSEDGG